MKYCVEFSPASDRDLQRFRAFEQRRIAEAIRQQLASEPNVENRNRKILGEDVTADFAFEPPLWELRVGDFRVFYEIDDDQAVVYIHAVRRKPPNKTTAEVLNEDDDN